MLLCARCLRVSGAGNVASLPLAVAGESMSCRCTNRVETEHVQLHCWMKTETHTALWRVLRHHEEPLQMTSCTCQPRITMYYFMTYGMSSKLVFIVQDRLYTDVRVLQNNKAKCTHNDNDCKQDLNVYMSVRHYCIICL